MLSPAIGTIDEHLDLLGSYATYEEHYQHVQSIVRNHEQKYCHNEVDNVDLDENGPPERAHGKGGNGNRKRTRTVETECNHVRPSDS